MKLTNQEKLIASYLQARPGTRVAWQELAQFAKDPQNVKLSTIQKAVGDVKRKLREANLPELNITFYSLTTPVPEPKVIKTEVKQEQTLVEMRRTIGGRMVSSGDTRPDAQIDFPPDPKGNRRVITRNGPINLGENEWDMYKHFYKNPGKKISITDLRDEVIFPKQKNTGKLPANWRDSIQRIAQNLRRQLELKDRLTTIPGGPNGETKYIFE